MTDAGTLFLQLVREPSEEHRMELVRMLIRSPREVLEEVAKRVGAEAVPDTVIARTSVETVVAALAVLQSEKQGSKLRVVAPSRQVPGWLPLNTLLDYLAEEGLANVFRVDMTPRARARARDLAAKAVRVIRGISPKVVDVTDAPPFIVAGLYSAGVRVMTILVDLEVVAVFQKFGFIIPV